MLRPRLEHFPYPFLVVSFETREWIIPLKHENLRCGSIAGESKYVPGVSLGIKIRGTPEIKSFISFLYERQNLLSEVAYLVNYQSLSYRKIPKGKQL